MDGQVNKANDLFIGRCHGQTNILLEIDAGNIGLYSHVRERGGKAAMAVVFIERQ